MDKITPPAKRYPSRSSNAVLEMHYSPAQVALALSLHKQTVLKLIHDGAFGTVPMPVGKEYRIPASAINHYLDSVAV
jgi:excisionase family DNA binding protein